MAYDVVLHEGNSVERESSSKRYKVSFASDSYAYNDSVLNVTNGL